jgi:hypothetical protein
MWQSGAGVTVQPCFDRGLRGLKHSHTSADDCPSQGPSLYQSGVFLLAQTVKRGHNPALSAVGVTNLDNRGEWCESSMIVSQVRFKQSFGASDAKGNLT